MAGEFARYRGGDHRRRHSVRFAEKPRFAKSNRFIWWHVPGLVDFVVAVGTDVLFLGAFATLYQPTVASSTVAEIPLGLIPAFFVPLLAIMHFAAIFKAFKGLQDAVESSMGLASRGVGLCGDLRWFAKAP